MKKFLYKNKDVILVSLLFIALLLIVFGDVIFRDYVFIRRDISRYYYPIRSLAAETLKNGETPLWNPYMFCGLPLHGTIQNTVFYPLSIIYYLMDTARGLSIFTIVHIFLAGIFMYLFAKYIGISKEGSFLAGFTFMFSGYIMGTICLTIGLSSVTWFPLTALLFVMALKEKKYKFSVLLSLALSFMFLAGDPTVTIATFSILVLVSVYLLAERLIKERKFDIFLIYNLLITSTLFFLFTAFQTFPAIEYFARTSRQALSWKEASAWSMPYGHFLSLVIPYFNDASLMSRDIWDWQGQIWLDNFYIGIITLILCGFAVRFGIKKRTVKLLVLMGLVSLAVSLGRNFIVYFALYKFIPFFNLVRYPVRFFFIFTFSICALAGIGYDYLKNLLKKNKLKRLSRIFLIIGFILVLVVIFTMLSYGRIENTLIERFTKIYEKNQLYKTEWLPLLIRADIFNFRRTLLYVSCFGLFIFLWSRTKFKKFMPFIILALASFDIIFTNTGFEPLEKRIYFKKPSANIRYLKKDKTLFRVFPTPYAYDKFTLIRGKTYQAAMESCKDLLIVNRMMEFGIYDAWGYDSTRLKRNAEVVQEIYKFDGPAETKLLDLLNVKYVVSHDKMEAKGYKKVRKTEVGTLYENTNYLPRTFLARKKIVFNNDEGILKYMLSKEFNPAEEVIFEEKIELPPSTNGKVREDNVNIIKYKPHLIEIEVTAHKPAFLVLSDTYYPGWKVYIDDTEEKIYRADYFLRAVKVPDGTHLVRFVYEPMSFRIGSIISIVSLLSLVLFVAFRRLRLTRV